MAEYSEILRRLERLEDTDESLKEAINQLVLTTTTMAQTLEQLAKVEPIVTQLRLDNQNNKLILGAVRWLGITVGGSAVAMVVTYLIKAI